MVAKLHEVAVYHHGPSNPQKRQTTSLMLFHDPLKAFEEVNDL